MCGYARLRSGGPRQIGGGELTSLAQSSFASSFSLRTGARRMVIVSSGETEPLLQLMSAKFGRRVEVVRVIRPDENDQHERLSALLSPEALRNDHISGIIVANGDHQRLPVGLLFDCRLNGIQVLDESTFWEHEAGCINIDDQGPGWLLSSKGFRYGRITEIRTRLFDLLLAAAGLILAFPLMLIIAVLIKSDGGCVLYRQERVGLRGRIFTLYKFRSMHENAEDSGRPQWATIGDPRITRLGRFIRYARIDELPQLLNVLRGDMSVIGPRPERPYFVEQLTAAIPLYCLRHGVKPGITGWAQVKASYGASIEDARVKLRYDLYYIKHRGLILDLSILLRTLRVVMLLEGAR
jgi:exopolysaccharide biosynthesis polyprenyl glycosylphosphotransferase